MEAPATSTPAPAADTAAADDAAANAEAANAGAASPAVAPVARTIGERLKAGRERSGLSIAAAGEKLHLDPKVIEALEADRFAEVGASVYVRGHLRRYGDFVGENGTELVGMYGARESRAATPDLTQVPQPKRRADPRRLVAPLAVLSGAGVLLAAIWWVLSGSRSMDVAPPPAAAANAPAPVVEEAAMAPALAQGSNAMATPVALSNAPAQAPSAASPVPAAGTTAETAPAVREAVARETRLRLELTNDSWVEVYDSSGQRLFYDVATGGSVQSVSGRGPLRVVLENAAGVTVEVDGQPREIPAGAVDGERARFVVNRSGTLSRSR